MTKELREQMDALRQIGPRLNKASEDAAKIIAEVESFLNGLHLGIAGRGDCYKSESYIEQGDEDDHRGTDPRREVGSYLAYDRGPSGDFEIHVLHVVSANEVDTYGVALVEIDTNKEPWSRCKRGDRLKAFETLPSLLAAIFQNATASATGAEKATATIRETMTTLGIESPPSATDVPKPGRKPRS